MATTMEERKALKQKRKVARRAAEKAQATVEMAYKPLEEWDEEELARGRPRNVGGYFSGPKPQWLTRAIVEESGRRFQELMRSDLQTLVPISLHTVRWVMETDGFDKRGRPLVPPSVKLQAAQWVIEHLLGKPRQRIEADISVKLQGILAQCLVVPGQSDEQPNGNVRPAIDVESWLDPEDDSAPGAE